jgi:WD40 repeat protein
LSQRLSKRNTVHRKFLEDLAKKQQAALYVRPEVRLAKAKAAALEAPESPTHEAAAAANADSMDSPGSKKPIAFGLHDALDLNTITELRKVFFSTEKGSDDEGSGDESPSSPTSRSENNRMQDWDDDNADADAASPGRETDLLDMDDGDDDDMLDGNWESRGLDLDEFIEEFGHIIGTNLSHQELQTMFMKIDANSDGDVDWDEFTNWMLKMEAGAHSMTEDKDLGELKPFCEQEGENPTLHRGVVSTIAACKIPGLSYVTGGRDGTIRFWNASTLEHVKTINVMEASRHYMKLHTKESNIPGADSLIRAASTVKGGAKKLWVTDIQIMSLCNRIAVAAADRSITFFDLFTMEVACRVRNLQHTPTSMTYHVSGTHSRVQFLTYGDDAGNIHVFKLKPHFAFKEGLDEFGDHMFDYWKGKSGKLEKQGLLEYYSQALHKDWITKCIFIGDIQPSILTCSLDQSVKFFNVEKKTVEREFKGHKESKEGVQALLYIKAVKCMASCGVGRTICCWNPHTCQTMLTLRGHIAPVTHLAVDDANARLISISMDKVIKFWDTSTWRCMQTTADTTNYRPDNFITSVFWDPDSSQLVTAGNRVKIWHHEGTEGVEDVCSHESAVCSALWNKNFNQVVSGDASSVVKVWAIETGQLVFRFDKLHGDSKITTMSFDWSMRRLLTGAHDGSVRMWNFSNGSQLKDFIREDDEESDGQPSAAGSKTIRNDSEVTAVRYILEEGGADDIEHKFIVSCGWDKKVRVFEEGDDDVVEPHRIFPAPGFAGHSDDVLCIAHCEPRLLATGSYDGEIVVWSLASGSGRFFLRLSDYGDHDDPHLNRQQHKDERARRRTMDTRESRSNRPSAVWNDDVVAAAASAVGGALSIPNSATATPQPPAARALPGKGGSGSKTFGGDHRLLVEQKVARSGVDKEGLVYQKAKAHLGTSTPTNVHHHTAKAGGGGTMSDGFSGVEVPSSEKGKLAVECLLFLKTKRIGEVLGQTLVSTGADGKVRFWSVKDGSLCHVLKACHPNDASITAMASDDDNKYLFTGCAGGYVKAWTLKSLEKAAGTRLHRRFSVLGADNGESAGEEVAAHRQWADSAVANNKAHRGVGGRSGDGGGGGGEHMPQMRSGR